MKREAKFGNEQFAKWMMSPYSKGILSAPYETKQTTKDYIGFDCVPEHQLDSLFACTTDKGFLYKISDESRGHKPFDYIFYRNSPAYVVIKYPKIFHIISVINFIQEKKMSSRKSLTSQRASEISIRSVNTKS